jgi:hypothetical protein
MMLQEAERLGLLKQKKKKTPELEEIRNKQRKEEEAYLHHRIIKAERKKPFKVLHYIIKYAIEGEVKLI